MNPRSANVGTNPRILRAGIHPGIGVTAAVLFRPPLPGSRPTGARLPSIWGMASPLRQNNQGDDCGSANQMPLLRRAACKRLWFMSLF
jgi:hypothetical protein